MHSTGKPGLVRPARRPWYHVAFLVSALIAACLSLTLLPETARATTGTPLAWSTQTLVEQPPFATQYPLEFVTCPTIKLCVVTDDKGNVLTSTAPTGGPASWTSKSLYQGYDAQNPVTCSGTSFCLVSADGAMYLSTDPTSASPKWRLTATLVIQPSVISCPSTHLCVAFGQNGGQSQIATSTDPTAAKPSWKVTPPDTPDPAISGLACVTSTFCVAVDSGGNLLTATNPAGGASAWHLVNIDGSDSLSNVTCPTTTFCATLDNAGRLLYSTNPMDGAAWHVTTAPQPAADPAGVTGLDCRSASFCSAFDGVGNVFTTSDPAGGSAAWQTSLADPDLNDLSCPSAQLCVIADARGDLLTSTTPAGGASTWVETLAGGVTAITALDCPTRSMCIGGDQEGHILASTAPAGGSAAWKLSNVDSPSTTIGGISCPDASLCVAVDSIGDLLTSTDPAGGAAAWTKLSIPGVTIDAVTCHSTTFCVAVGSSGQVLTSSDPVGGASAWTSTGATLMLNATAISCPSTSLCVATGDGDQTHGTGTGTGWLAASVDPAGSSPWTSFGMNAVYFASVSCPSTSLCVAAGSTEYSGSAPQSEFLLTERVFLRRCRAIRDLHIDSPIRRPVRLDSFDAGRGVGGVLPDHLALRRGQ
jgi:hypothetical protein